MRTANPNAASILVTTAGQPRQLARCLRALTDQTQLLPYEILVADVDGDRRTQRVIAAAANRAASHISVRHLAADIERPLDAVRLTATAPVIALLDADTVASPDWLREGLSTLAAETRVAAIGLLHRAGMSTSVEHGAFVRAASLNAIAPGRFQLRALRRSVTDWYGAESIVVSRRALASRAGTHAKSAARLSVKTPNRQRRTLGITLTRLATAASLTLAVFATTSSLQVQARQAQALAASLDAQTLRCSQNQQFCKRPVAKPHLQDATFVTSPQKIEGLIEI